MTMEQLLDPQFNKPCEKCKKPHYIPGNKTLCLGCSRKKRNAEDEAERRAAYAPDRRV